MLVLAGAATACGSVAMPALAAAPSGRGYELVSPPDKNGGDIVPDTARTRAATDGEAIGFLSLSAFADPIGTSIASEYIAQRSSEGTRGSNGWTTHAINPPQVGIPFRALAAQFEPKYEGEFTDDLDTGVFYAFGTIDDNPMVRDVGNLYLRTNLRTPGGAQSQLLSPCVLCEESNTPLPPLPRVAPLANRRRTMLAGMSPDAGHVVFETSHSLTADSAVAQDSSCDPVALTIAAQFCRVHVYEWDNGTLRLAGILPDGRPADASIAGNGVGASHGLENRTPHVVSDGSDGHTRVFFTQPTNALGQTSSQLTGFARFSTSQALSGNLFARIDGTSTVQLNESERTTPDVFAPAQFLDASADGTRAFFRTTQAMTDDATSGGTKLYMYDAAKTANAPDNLTLLNPDIGLGSEAYGIIGASEDGHRVYMLVTGQLVRGGPPLPSPGLFLWNDGAIDFIGYVPAGSGLNDVVSTGAPFVISPRQARVSPDGRHLLFSAVSGAGLTGYDHGTCQNGLGAACREIYLYSADSRVLRCVSCRPDGQSATVDAHVMVRTNNSGASTSWHETNALSRDGRFVFFSTAEALVGTDVNGRVDAYLYDTALARAQLLSSGQSAADSWFMDSSADGRDAFFLTREPLVGWDVDTAYDLYDARVGGGFPEPTRALPGCSGESCQGLPGLAPAVDDGGSEVLRGDGDAAGTPRPRPRGRAQVRRCRRGFVKKRVRARRRCVKRDRRSQRPGRTGVQRKSS